MTTDLIENWNVTIDPWYSYATRHTTKIEVDHDYLVVVDEQQGSGYLRVMFKSSVPISVLFRLLTQAGYRVERDESGVIRPTE